MSIKVICIAFLLVMTAFMGRPGAQTAPAGMPPAEPAKDLKTALYKAADALGMLRTPQEHDAIMTFEYWATGTVQVQGKPCQASEYRASVRYPAPDGRDRLPVPAMRVDVTCAGTGRQIHVVAGEYAWNETEPGGGTITPMPAAAQERLLQVWSLPHGLLKAATLAGPKATLAMEGGKPTVTFPLPAPLQNATAKMTLDPANFMFHTMPTGVRRYFSHRIERVETRLNNVVTVTTYSDYGDWNAPDYKSDVHLPKRMVSDRNGARVMDLTLSLTQTYNPYVIMPVPDSVRQASR